jgi:Fe(3+) dicitrate transport protein
MNNTAPFTAALATIFAFPLSAQDSTLKRPALELPALTVIGSPSRLRTTPGSGTALDALDLARVQPRSLNEALRQVPGVLVREEEGLGLRPNIGIRGLNPTRSTTVLLLEDGIPFSLAPYGDNASYYVPPIDRFVGVEVLKGSGQIAYGPRTIGGVINLLSPRPPALGHAGRLSVAAGSRDYRMVHARYGYGAFGHGVLADLLHKRAASARANLGTTITDATLTGEARLPGAQTVTLKGNLYRERSQVTYSGLTEAEYAADPFQNPFVHDSMFMDRAALLATHQAVLGARAVATTRLYASWLSRDWWRQSSNSAERPNDASDPDCGGMANLRTTCGNQGRLRDYRILGIEPRVSLALPALGPGGQLEAGLRVQLERQLRRQENGDTPLSRRAGPTSNPNAGLVEHNLRRNAAIAAFVQPRMQRGDWTVTPGLRLEYVEYQRTNRLAPDALTGRTSLARLIPGLGATWSPAAPLTVFAGLHRGFAPPRTEDILTNAGGVVDLEAEVSWNSELGMRYQGARGLRAEVTLFQLDFSNQIVPASVAGGSGATVTSAGRTLHRGMEFAARIGTDAWNDSPHLGWLEVTWTWLPVARFEGERYAWIGTAAPDVPGKVYLAQNAAGTRTRVSVSGNRLPYAPEHLLTAAANYAWGNRFDLRLEAAHTGAQFGDPVNTRATVPDGQQGPISPATVWSMTAGYQLSPIRTRLWFAVNNLFDTRYLVDRSRGLLPGMPRSVRAGAAIEF